MTAPGILPAMLVVGGGIYVLQTQAPPSMLPPVTVPGGPTNQVIPPNNLGLDPNAQPGSAAKVDALLSAAEAKFSSMSDDAKVQAAQEMNQQLNLQPPLTGRETWQQVASIAGGAAGSAACAAVLPGIGMAAGPLCAIAGSYLGVSLESWLASSLDDVQNWINQNIPGAVGHVVDDVKNWLDSIL